MTWHPSKGVRLGLPILGEKVIDARQWGYPDPHAPRGFARLRVWDVPSAGCCFAIVTETGTGMSVTAAAAEIYARLDEEYGLPTGLAELHPEGGRGTLHLDLVRPSEHRQRMEWLRLFPTGIGGTVPGWNPDVARLWVSVHAAEIFEP